MENIRSEVKKWIETIEDYDLIEVWNKVSENTTLCKMDSLDDLFENRRIKEVIEIISNCESDFNIHDDYIIFDKVNDYLTTANDIFDLINKEYLISYIVDTKKDFGFQVLKAILNSYGLKQNNEGIYFQTEKRRYNLYEGKSIKGDKDYTSDIIFIMNDDGNKNAKVVNFVYGATLIDDNLIKTIENMIKEYEDREDKNL